MRALRQKSCHNSQQIIVKQLMWKYLHDANLQRLAKTLAIMSHLSHSWPALAPEVRAIF